jgi:hypothetical protein
MFCCIVTGKEFTTLHSLPLPCSHDVGVAPDDFQQPLFQLWNPNITHHDIVKGALCRCITCGSPYHMGYWNDGSSAYRQPRIIHGVDNIVFLVSAVYVCSNNYRLLAHDPVIQNCFCFKSVIPFVLLHKTGFTREFAEM